MWNDLCLNLLTCGDSMQLKFIGKNLSMGLRYGKIYDVTIKSDSRYIYVLWRTEQNKVMSCPYSSPATLAENWINPLYM